ncbi:hypothetical protein [Parvularcula sp. IMCC14364]|uniref:hypothetical protein n=1 Tax=Parvularcula sp. IMCC14364 TaxID=3067902 RepID=UPI0027413744|nr:hypothetical protein [Parvularcula sp. IMCC14364]
MKKLSLYAVSLFLAVAPANLAAAPESDREEPQLVTTAQALAHWDKVFDVFSHPRCANCHVPADNRPRWSGKSFGLDDGKWQYHGMNIDGGETRDGSDSIPCAACHADSNSELPHGPPGAPHWALAPVEMVWWDQTSLQICEQIKDTQRNGGRTLQAVADHIAHDALVHWGWEPGPGREPAPYSITETVTAFESWAASGAPCPAE